MQSTVNNTFKSMKVALGTAGCALIFAVAAVAPAAAGPGDPPPGWIFQLAGPGQGVLSNYQQFSTTFTASSNLTYVSFAFREIPRYFAFDDVSVVDVSHPSGNLLSDPGFEAAMVGQNVPTGWGRWIQPIDRTAIGVVASGSGSACAPNGPHSGANFWCDGSVEGYDALWQKIHTHPGDQYQIRFYLGDNSGQTPYNPGIDMFAYAGNSLPGGTQNLPEPSSLALFGSGVAGMAGLLRRKLSP
jgi:hypothetical protein